MSIVPDTGSGPPVRAVRRRTGRGERALDCWLAGPLDATAPPVVAVHGIARGAREQAALLAARADARGRLVVAPRFGERRWPRYQQAVRGGRADLALLALMNELRLTGLWRTPTVDLAGFSGGAQFAHRFAMLYPHLVGRLVVGSAGWYTHPDEAPFPYGLGPDTETTGWGARMRAGLDRFLALPLRVVVGAEDRVSDPNTRRGPLLDAQQGTHRLERAHRWARALREAAGRRGIAADVSVEVLAGCGHDFADCVVTGGLDRIVLDEDRARAVADARRGCGACRSAA
ncbi:MAG: alpha/beta fold hydrolase [Paracoccaceae bacterium]